MSAYDDNEGKPLEELVGKTIAAIRVSDGQGYLAFDTDEGTVAFEAEGDCCSVSWFADLTGVDALIGGTVVAVEKVGMDGYNIQDGRGRQESDQVYGFKFSTDKGRATLAFRNSSNGYYGGWLNAYRKELPGGMVPITDDWSA